MRLVAAALVAAFAFPSSAQEAQEPIPSLRPRWVPTKDLRLSLPPVHDPLAIVLKLRDDGGAVALGGRLAAAGPQSVAGVSAVLDRQPGARVTPLLAADPADLRRMRAEGQARTGEELADLTQLFRVEFDAGVDLSAVLAGLFALDEVENAYAAPLPAAPPGDILPPATPSFTGSQGYRGAAPAGIDAGYALTQPGGNGAGVTVLDVEYAWRYTHEDLSSVSAASHVGPAAVPPPGTTDDHGTAVLGILNADNDAPGVTGIVPAATVLTAAANTAAGFNVASAIVAATQALSSGDVMLLEMQNFGPNYSFALGGQFGYVPVEFYNAEFFAIRQATALGIHVVEAGANGSQDLDSGNGGVPGTPGVSVGDPSYPILFSTAVRDSHAILVGATTSTVPHAPHSFSSKGTRIDVNAWGDSVFTLAYGPNDPSCADPFAAAAGDANQWYTQCFSGTSSASAIAAGAAAVLEAAHVAKHGEVMHVDALRHLLRTTGTPSGNPPVDRVGRMPDLRAQLALVQTGPQVGWKIDGLLPGDHRGQSVANAGDLDGDGVNDLLVGDPGYDFLSTNDVGQVRGYSGRTGSLIMAFGLPTGTAELGFSTDGLDDVDGDGRVEYVVGAPLLDQAHVADALNSVSATMTGEVAGDLFGRAVASIGDVTGDGIGDYVVGAPSHDTAGFDAGRAYVFSGTATSTSASNALFTVSGGAAQDFLGWSVAGVGDVNQDGTPDFAAGAPQITFSGLSNGYVGVYSGVDATKLLHLSGTFPGDRLGTSVDGAGDTDFNGYADVLCGAPGDDTFAMDSGRVQLRDGFGGILLNSFGAAPLPLGGTTIPASSAVGSSVAGGFDVDLDGNPDLIAGAPAMGGFTGAGKAYVYSWAKNQILATYAGASPFPGLAFGTSVASLGDLDGDGRAELAVGAPNDDAGASDTDEGGAYVYFGSPAIASVAAPTLVANLPAISASAGGSSLLQVQAGPAQAGKVFVMVGSIFGSAPGTPIGGLVVPVNLPTFYTAVGTLDGGGSGSTTLGPFPPGFLTVAVGIQATFAALTTDLAFTTNAATVTIVF